MKSFITFAAGESYERLAEVLKESIETFSEYDLIVYKPEDFDIKWEPENWQPSYVFIYKVLSCLKALETYDELVWLDNDCLVTKNIDKIWERKINNYPLLPNERFNNFHKLLLLIILLTSFIILRYSFTIISCSTCT